MRRGAWANWGQSRWRAALAIALVNTSVALSVPGYAQEQPHGQPPASRGAGDVSPEVAQEAASIARQTMSPFCPGRTLADCPSEYAADWRRDIREMVAAGKSAAEIQAELEKRAGGNLSGIPNHESSYALPIGLATAAALFLFFVFARLRKGSGPSSPTPPTQSREGAAPSSPPPVDDQRLADELDVED